MSTSFFKEIDIKVAALRQTNVKSDLSFKIGDDVSALSAQPKEIVKFFTK